MAALSNPKHERFAQELAKGKSASAAYVEAGYAASDANASRLTGNDRVRMRVAELQERAAIRTEITIAEIATMLQEDRRLAHTGSQAGAAVSASMGLAKLFGLIVDKCQAEVTVRTHEEALADLA